MVVTLTGSNTYLIKAELKKIIDAFLAVHGDLGLQRIDASEAEVSRIIEAVQSMPFLSDRNMVVIDGISNNKQLAEDIEKVLNSAAQDTDLIIYDQHLDKRTLLYKTLKKSTDLREFAELDERTLPKWLVATAKEQGGQISEADATYLVTRLGTDQLLLSNELEKLLTNNPKVTREVIDALTEPSPQSKIFDLLDAAFAGKTSQALLLYEDQRIQRVEPQQIVAMLSWQLQIMALVKAAGDRSPDQIAKEAKMSPFVARKTMSLVRSMGMNDIRRLVARLLEIDVLSKTTALDLDEALKTYISIELKK